MESLADRVVLVTGAAGSLGRVVVARFARAGARVGLVGTDAGRLAALGVELGLDAERSVACAADLRDADGAREAAAAVARQFGRVDVLIHLVGGWAGGTAVVDLDRGEVAQLLDQHLWTTLHVIQAVIPGMVERGWGRVVVASSPQAVEPAARGASYAVAKAAEETLVRTLAREVAGTGVTANIVSIRAIDTAGERERAPSRANAAWATPDEIAEVVLFLCSAAGAPINGARLPLDGRG